jgi:hypothetical protein
VTYTSDPPHVVLDDVAESATSIPRLARSVAISTSNFLAETLHDVLALVLRQVAVDSRHSMPSACRPLGDFFRTALRAREDDRQVRFSWSSSARSIDTFPTAQREVILLDLLDGGLFVGA